MKDYRGVHKKVIGIKNKDAVRSWMNNNPDGMMKDCCDYLELSRVTVSKHIKSIKEEEGKVRKWIESKQT